MLRMRTILLALVLTLAITVCANNDYTQDAEYLALRDSMRHAFNDGDSARFFPALKNLQDYLVKQNDLHAYYNQRCNEIVFLMNQQKIFEAYKLARDLSKELREKKIDKEMYMAYNMLGHINRYCGNKEEAKKNWYDVISMMEQEGYYSNLPPIYMNIVNVALDDSPEEADSLLNVARRIAEKYAPERVFDIETRKTLSYYYRGDIDRFLEGYKTFKEGEEKGQSSVHGREMDVYYTAYLGHIDEAVQMAREELGDEGRDAITLIYEKAGRWKDAFEALKEQTAAGDSIDNVVLTNSMMGIREEMIVYETEAKAAKTRLYLLTAVIALLSMLTIALVYIVQTRRKHLNQLKNAYNHALESDKMKTAFIQNVSHEVRTPLNIIGGFSQVIADPELTDSVEERQNMANMMQKSARQITDLIDEMLILSLNENLEATKKDDQIEVNDMLRDFLQENETNINQDTVLRFESLLAEDYTIMTNENMLRTIVKTLVDNAIKNTSKGSITLKVAASDTDLTLTVEDTGCGIPAKDAERIFERFVKLDTFKEGIGLGLPICRTLTKRLGGTVGLDTSYQGGARFIVTIPIT